MTEFVVWKSTQRLLSFMSLGHWLAVSAIALTFTWALASWGPVVFVLLLIAFNALVNTYSLQLQISFLRTVTPTPLLFVYEFWLTLTDRAWDTLGLTPEERAILNASPSRPIGFILERWRTHTHSRLHESEAGRIRERTTTNYDYGGNNSHSGKWVLWSVPLKPASEVRITWESESERRVVSLFAFGGRFKWFGAPSGAIYPEIEHVLFEIPFPPVPYRPLNAWRDPFDSKMDAYRPFGSSLEIWREIEPHLGKGVELYECNQLEEKGFRWVLIRRDLRPQLVATVAKIHKGSELTVRLTDSGVELRGSLALVEPDKAGQTTVHLGEAVLLVLSDDFKIDRIWPWRHFYVPAKCPQCKKPQGYWSNQDGVCHGCRPPKTCARCFKEFDQRMLHEEHGELVCSDEHCRAVQLEDVLPIPRSPTQ